MKQKLWSDMNVEAQKLCIFAEKAPHVQKRKQIVQYFQNEVS